MESLVWVIDRITGHGYPIAKEVAEGNPERYRADDFHPVRDSSGRPLPPKFHQDITTPPRENEVSE